MSRSSKLKKTISEEDEFFDAILTDRKDAPVSVDANGWPSSVPILTEEDIVWQYSDSRGRHDLYVWLELVFNPDYPEKDTKAYRKAYRTLCRVLSERFDKKVTVLYRFMEFVYRNKLPSKAWQAACWNAMLIELGYDIPKNKAKNPDG